MMLHLLAVDIIGTDSLQLFFCEMEGPSYAGVLQQNNNNADYSTLSLWEYKPANNNKSKG